MTTQIRLLPATVASVTAALEKDHDALAAIAGARVPASFPPDLLDNNALRWTINAIQDPAHDDRYGMSWIIADTDDGPALVGTAGVKGRPIDGCIEIGYGVVAEYQRRGIATAATRELVRRAFLDPDVRCVIAETLPDLAPSIGVLEKCGFQFVGEGSEPGVIRYRLDRPTR